MCVWTLFLLRLLPLILQGVASYLLCAMRITYSFGHYQVYARPDLTSTHQHQPVGRVPFGTGPPRASASVPHHPQEQDQEEDKRQLLIRLH